MRCDHRQRAGQRTTPVFDQRAAAVSHLLPATHFMGAIKTLLLAGTHWPTVLQSAGILALYAVVLLVATTRTLRKTLD